MKNRHSMTYIALVLMVLMVACTTRERNAEWLQQAEAYHKAGKVDSTLACLYKINEERLSVEDSYAFLRLKYSNTLSKEPGAMEQIMQTAAYYEERGDTAHLEQMRKVLLSNYRYEQMYTQADSLLRRMHRDYTDRNDSASIRWICSMRSALLEQQGRVCLTPCTRPWPAVPYPAIAAPAPWVYCLSESKKLPPVFLAGGIIYA